jgi:nucleotide-binding universal stress UspA family protein
MVATTPLNTKRGRRVLARPTALLLATDGTPQSEAAVSLAYLMAVNNQAEVRAVTVVNHTPVPWGTVDPSLVSEYERGLHEEARARVRAQLDRFGDKRWSVDVQTGDPASTIAEMARESRARLVVVGLGGHNVAARLFGNETALRLMRASQAPVLAVDAKLRALPKNVVAAIDFSQSSMEAAQLAIEIASPGATVTLVHVVPWERKEYIPEQWFREHEAYIAGELQRVAGWLDHPRETRIHKKVLYGRPAPLLLACAEELDAELIVAGTHGRGLLSRIVRGATLSKLVRGARRSVLVFPAAATFQQLGSQESTTSLDGVTEV